MSQIESAVQAFAEMSARADAMLDRNGVLITEGAIVTLYPKKPWAQSWLGEIGKVTLLITTRDVTDPVCVIVPGTGCLCSWAPDEVEVDTDPIFDVTYATYSVRRHYEDGGV